MFLFFLRTCPISPWTKVDIFSSALSKVADFEVMSWLHVEMHLYSVIWMGVLKCVLAPWANSGSLLFPAGSLADWAGHGRLAHAVLATGQAVEMLLNEAEMIHACKTVDLCLSVVNHPLFHTARIFQLPQTNYPNALALMFPYVGVKGVVLSCLDHRDYSTIETVTTSSPFGLHCKKTALWNSGCFSAKNWSKIKQWESSSHGASYLCRMDPEDQCGNDVPAARLASVLATKGIRSLPVKTCTV